MSRDSTNRWPSFRPRFDSLEDRTVPAQFGVPWTEPMHLTVSFAPDGTSIAGEPSRLQSRLDAQMPREVWQGTIMRAFQSWAELANLNVGVRSDGGQSFGATGATQGDPRFGDVRVGGLPMTSEAMAVSSPPGFTTGTFTGDIFLNTAEAFTPDLLYATALHEAGHALGLPHSTDPKSVMFSHLNHNTTLTAGDTAAIRTLYGPRTADANEGDKGNGSIKEATRLRYPDAPGESDGSTPVVGYGDITTRTDVDLYYVKGFRGYTGPITFRVQTEGVSLLAARVTVYDEARRVLATSTGTGVRGSVVTLTIPRSVPDARYFVQVEAAPNATYKIGRFGIGVTFDGLFRPPAISLDEVLRGPFEGIDDEDMHELFLNPNSVYLDDDLHADDTIALATNLRYESGQPSPNHVRTTASISDATDVDFYRLRTPQAGAGQSFVLTASVRAADLNGVVPRIEVFDRNAVRLPATVLVNGNGTFTVQATGLRADSNAYVRVFSPAGVGNYDLDVMFGSVAADRRTFANETLAAGTMASYQLYVAQTQLFSFALTTTGLAGAVRMELVNKAGQVVFTLTSAAGETATAMSTLLPPGEYTVRFTSVGATGPLAYTLKGSSDTDPVGPVADSTRLAPQYVAPNDPNRFLYPNGTLTTNPYLWVFSFRA